MKADRLFPIVASHLSGRECEVYWRRPPNPRYLARTYRWGNKAVIELSPSLMDDERLLHIFLHEVAHAKTILPQLPDHSKVHGPFADIPAHQSRMTTRFTSSVAAYRAAPEETLAETYARRWAQWAEKHCSYPNGELAIDAELRTLLRWR